MEQEELKDRPLEFCLNGTTEQLQTSGWGHFYQPPPQKTKPLTNQDTLCIIIIIHILHITHTIPVPEMHKPFLHIHNTPELFLDSPGMCEMQCPRQSDHFWGGLGYVLIFLFLWYSLWSLLNPAWKLKENSIFFISVIMNLTLKSIVFYFSNGEEYNYIPYLLIRNTHSLLYTPLVLLVCLSVSSLASTFQDIMFFVILDRNKSLSLFNLNNLTFKIKMKVKA